MIETKFWYDSLPGDGAATAYIQAALEQLRGVGLVPLAVDRGDPPRGVSVVFFDAVGPKLFDLLRAASRNGSAPVLAVARARAALGDNAWRLLQAGASDVLVWEGAGDPAGDVAARVERWEQIGRVVDSPLVKDNLVGESGVWRALLRRVVEAALFSDAPLLLIGESGTGKELLARLIHTLDRRPDKRDLITLDCTTVAPELAGSEFFGHERGAFTSAVAARDGAFALADGGTLFLDEVGELPLRLQAELLRVVQEHTYKRVGSNVWQKTNFRLICATNRDLEEASARGDFRLDFYYRIAGWVFRLPPLRERAGDILPLACNFMRRHRPGVEPPEFDEPVRDYLLRRDYPGNVRDLKQLMTRIMTSHVGPGPVTVGDIAENERPCVADEQRDWRDVFFEDSVRRALALGHGLKEITSAAADTAIRLAIEDEEGRGRLKRAAQRLGVTERALQMHRATRREVNAVGAEGGEANSNGDA
ncbi:MAG TPA: sigma 54-interacting transcriptional regulator [Pyrinomonadaceae bacterium]